MTRAASNPAYCSLAKSEIESASRNAGVPIADHRADIGAKPVLVGPIVLRDRARVRPGAKEQREEPALEDVDETRKRVVAFEQPTVGLFGRRQRQRALRAEHAQEAGHETHAPGRFDARGFEVRVGKFEIRILRRSSTNSSREPARVADARLGRIFALEPPQTRRTDRSARARRRVPARNVTETPRSPMRGGQRMISPRSAVRMTVWVKWLIATYSAKNRSRTAPSRNAPGALEGLVFQDDRDLEPARRRRALRLPQPPHDRPRRRRCARRGSCVGRAVGEIGEQDQRLAQRLRRRRLARSTSPR